MQKVLIVLQIITAFIIIASILAQPSKMDGFTNFVSGTSETFFSRNKSKTRESRLARVTVISAIVFAIIVILQNIPKFVQ